MSHFAVLVIGDDYEAQLAPFHEFECTGINDQYVQNIDVLEKYREEWKEHGKDLSFPAFVKDWHGFRFVGATETPDIEGEHKYGWCRVDNINDPVHVLEVIDRTNENAKWDWYQVGGRWRGFFQAKAGAEKTVGVPGVFDNAPTFNADSVHKGDVDFDAMRTAAAAEAEISYTLYEDAIKGTPEPKSWDEIRESHGENIDAARAEYRDQPRIQALHKADIMPWFQGVEEVYGGGREAYVARAVASVAVPYALVIQSTWFAKGDMGWFGMSSDKMDENEWHEKVQELYDSLDDDTLLTLVDCHI